MKKTILTLGFTLGFLSTLVVQSRAGGAVNVDSNGVAIEGYDPVAYFVDHKAEKGDAKFQSAYEGATYDFASAGHKDLFEKEPAKYTPQFGGFCAYGTAQGHTSKVDPTSFQIVDGRLLLQYNAKVVDLFNKDQAGNLKKADANWPALAGKGN